MHEDLVDAAPHSFKYVPRSMPSEAGSALLQEVLLFGTRIDTPCLGAQHQTQTCRREACELAGREAARETTATGDPCANFIVR